MRPLVLLAILAGALLVCGSSSRTATPRRLPPIVFVSRRPAAESGAIPGMGPRHRAIATGGSLMVREPDGRIRRLLPEGGLFDVADPAVSLDGRWITFAGTPHADSAFRLYLVPAQGGEPEPITRTDAPGRFDDIDPCWIGDSLVCFASTRDADESEYGNVPASNLWIVRIGAAPWRLTHERNGAEEPTWDPSTGRIVYARWWYGRHRVARDPEVGVTTDPALAVPQDSVNLWHAIEIDAQGRGLRLAAGSIGSRAATMAYQPTRLADGSWCGVYARSLALVPGAGGAGIQIFHGRHRASERIAGALPATEGDDPYASARGLAVPCAVAPAGLADGRLIAAYDPGGRGDFGIVVMDRRGGSIASVVDFEGTLELDPVPLERRAARVSSPVVVARDETAPLTFTYDCRDVFAGGEQAPRVEGPRRDGDLVMRFFAVRVRPGLPDTFERIREAPVAPDGSIRVEGLPAETALFEQLVDRRRGVLPSAHGPAHVAGSNWAPAGSVARCTGCHLGHSALDPDREGRPRTRSQAALRSTHR